MIGFDESSLFASDDKLRSAGLLGSKNGVYLGHSLSSDTPIILPNMGHVTFVGGAGSNKTLWVILNFLYGVSDANRVYLDSRGDITNVTTLATTLNGFEQFTIAPLGDTNFPTHCTDPLAHLMPESINLVSDLEDSVEAIQPKPMSGTGNPWPKEDANRWLYALMQFLVYRDGCVSFRTLYELVLLIESDAAGGWANQLSLMERADSAEIRSFAGEIMAKQIQAKDSFTAPLSELKTTFSFMRDERVAAAFCGDDILPSDLVTPDRKISVGLIFPPEALKKWSTPIRAFFSAVMMAKRRNLAARPIEYWIDECSQLGSSGYAGIPQLYSFGRGERNFARCTFQNTEQMIKSWGKAGFQEIWASSQCRILKGVRDIETARMTSNMAGKFDAALQSGFQEHRKHMAVHEMLNGADPMAIATQLRQFDSTEQYQGRYARSLLTESDVLNMDSDKKLVFVSETNTPVILARSKRYFEMPELAGRYLDNPVYGKDHVDVIKRLLFGRLKKKTLRIIEDTVPKKYAHLPQYQHGTWRYVEGYKP